MDCRLLDLNEMHPLLDWRVPVAAAAAVLAKRRLAASRRLDFEIEDVQGFGTGGLHLNVSFDGIDADDVAKVRRSYQRPALVEEAAIAVAALGLYYAGGHEVRDIAVYGTGADYLVDANGALLEIAGRSRRRDMAVAWKQKLGRLRKRTTGGFYICVVEFETPAARLAFFEVSG